jgi:serine/threonine protein kinase
MVVGTPSYMSPEQARGVAVDFRTDLFSLGTVLYRLCTGHLPFSGPTTTAVLTELALADPPPASQVNPRVPAALSDLICRLLEKDPANRPKSARAVAGELQQIDLTPARPTAATMIRPLMQYPKAEEETEAMSQPVRPRRRRRRKTKGATDWLMGSVAVLALAGLAIGVPLAVYKAIPARKTSDMKPAEVVPTLQTNPMERAPTVNRPVEVVQPIIAIPQPMPRPEERPPPPPPDRPRRPGDGPPPGFPLPPPPGAPGGPPLGPRPGP